MGKSWKTKSRENKDRLRKKNAKKRKRTEWIFTSQYAEGTYMRVGLIHNKSEDNPYDIIAIQILNSSDEIMDWEMRIDEAQGLIFGLSKILTHILLDMGTKGKFLKEYYESGDQNEHTRGSNP